LTGRVVDVLVVLVGGNVVVIGGAVVLVAGTVVDVAVVGGCVVLVGEVEDWEVLVDTPAVGTVVVESRVVLLVQPAAIITKGSRVITVPRPEGLCMVAQLSQLPRNDCVDRRRILSPIFDNPPRSANPIQRSSA
jgi:hypothetical protein